MFFFSEDRNVIVPFCKIHNDSSIDVSQDGTLLGVFVPSEYGFPVDAELKVLSLRKSNFGQCIYSRKYGKEFFKSLLSKCPKVFLMKIASHC